MQKFRKSGITDFSKVETKHFEGDNAFLGTGTTMLLGTKKIVQKVFLLSEFNSKAKFTIQLKITALLANFVIKNLAKTQKSQFFPNSFEALSPQTV